MLWINVHLISWVLLVISVILAFALKDKLATIFIMVTRVLYIPILISGGFFSLVSNSQDPGKWDCQITIRAGGNCLIEISFAHKNRGSGSKVLYWTLATVFVVTTIFGFYLAGWYPIAWH
ncbi:DUF1516 family protein [Lentilactobacillus kisonensis]|uniref:DUF1516 family protein n=1 Tax=Lentilactobacillus kisonensis TaxID=481722 RepID=UPI000AFD1EF6|nr:DUF1516 family protein [Lentilactobacillus kisonensis]